MEGFCTILSEPDSGAFHNTVKTRNEVNFPCIFSTSCFMDFVGFCFNRNSWDRAKVLDKSDASDASF